MLRLALCLTALLIAVPAGAQEAQSAPPAVEMPNQAQIDAALDLLKANNTTGNMTALVDTLLPIQAATIKREHPGIDEAVVNKMLGLVRDTISAHEGELIQIYAVVYARHFTIEDMNTLAAFYRSDTGRKYIHEIPALMKEVAPLGNSYLQNLIAEAMADAVKKMRDQGVKI